MTNKERAAIYRVYRAGIRAAEYVVLSFVRAVGCDVVMASTLADIRAVANAF